MYGIFTVDVEGHVGVDPVEHLIYGKTKDGQLRGIDMLMDIFDQYHVKALFFVDIAEAWDYGEEKIAGVLKHIEERGHDVGVHIHPDHMADKNKLFLSEYTREEQYEMISKCTDFYEQTLGHRPLAFRAGKYGANRETLNILAEFGYKADFSEFYGHKWCHINPPVAKVNVQKLNNGLIEIPVTSYISIDIGLYSRYDKLDCSQTASEFKAVMNKLINKNEGIAVLFAHSFSLLDWRRKPNAPKYKRNLMKRLEKQLKYVDKCSDVNIINLRDAIDIYEKSECKDMSADSFVVLKGLRAFFWFADRAKSVIKSRIDIRLRKL